MEPLEVDDLNFYPCTCGYQVRLHQHIILHMSKHFFRLIRVLGSAKCQNIYICVKPVYKSIIIILIPQHFIKMFYAFCCGFLISAD